MNIDCKVCKENKKRWEESAELIYKHNPNGHLWRQMDRILEGKQQPVTLLQCRMLAGMKLLERIKQEAKMRGLR